MKTIYYVHCLENKYYFSNYAEACKVSNGSLPWAIPLFDTIEEYQEHKDQEDRQKLINSLSDKQLQLLGIKRT